MTPSVDIRHAKDGAVMVFVTAPPCVPVYVYRLKPPASKPERYLMRGKFEVLQGGKQ